MLTETQRPTQPTTKSHSKGIHGKIVFLSPRGGTGKSTLIANLALSLTRQGQRVGIADLDLKNPSQAQIFGVDHECPKLDSLLLDEASITKCATDLSLHLKTKTEGPYLLSPNPPLDDELSIYERGYSVNSLAQGLTAMQRAYKLDYLLIDTASGLDKDALVSMLTADHAIIHIRPDRQNLSGTTTILKILQKLGYTQNSKTASIIINNIKPTGNPERTIRQLKRLCPCKILEAIPLYVCSNLEAADKPITLREPTHPYSTRITQIANKLLNQTWSLT